MTVAVHSLLPDGVETTFPEIEAAMARIGAGAGGAARHPIAAATTATVVVVGPKPRLIEVAESARSGSVTGIRSIFIASGSLCTPGVRVTASEIALDGLRGEFIDNAVAALRLPSLPTVLWWRGGDVDRLGALAKLVEHVVLDVEDPQPLWDEIDTLIAEGPVGDLRWTALTRWRMLIAHFFDMPEIQAAPSRFSRLQIAGRDRPSTRLLAAWLVTSLTLPNVHVEFEDDAADTITRVLLTNGAEEVCLERLEGSRCVAGHARVDGHEASRVASLGEQHPLALMAEELRVRAHDTAFEAAVRAARTMR